MPGPVQSIERAAAILRLLARGSGRLGVGEIATSLGLAKGTTHGILRTLQGVGFVEQDKASGKYQLGAALLHLGTSYLDVNELRSRAINWADALASRSGEAVRIGTLLDGKVLVVHHVFRPDDSLQTLDVGALLPLHATALGKILLAYDADAATVLQQQGAVQSGTGQSGTGQSGAGKSDAGKSDTVQPGAQPLILEQFTRRTLTTGPAIGRAITQVREQGWAAELEESTPGQASIAAPIRGYGGLVVGAISIAGAVDRLYPTAEVPDPALVVFVQNAARAISRDLGAGRW